MVDLIRNIPAPIAVRKNLKNIAIWSFLCSLSISLSAQGYSIDSLFQQVKDMESDSARSEQIRSVAMSFQYSNSSVAFVIFLALLILGILFYVIYKQQNKIRLQNSIISDALAEKNVLLKEIHHRVKNNLQIISSLLSLQSRTVEDKQASTALEEGQNRVQSMALIHQHLYSGDNIVGVKVQQYLRDLCRNVFVSHQIDTSKVALDLDIDDIELDISSVVPLGLILNELITNACKYAFSGSRSGTVKVTLKEMDESLQVNVADDGIGMENSKKQGFGSKLISSLARKMDAQVEIENDKGTSVTLLIKKYKKVA